MTPGSGLVAWIAIAPVKAMALVQLDDARLESTGIRGDRAFAVVDDQLRLVNGKRLGALASIRPDHDPKTSALTLRFPDGGTVTDTVEMGDPAEAVFFGRPRSVRLVGGPWSEALSDWAGRELRLVALVGDGAGIDRGPSVSLLSAAALGVLAAAGGGVPSLDARRFRMTFGIEGIEPFAEDAWLGRRVRVGDALARPVDHVGRCAVTTQDPDTGIPDFPTLTVLQRLRSHISSEDEDLPCGVWAEVVEAGHVRLGDPVGPVEAVTRQR
ncbi:MAG: MOSC domain-containing protein [Acidimicrobiia bacterium]|nr:MOSC domain-containing protein [Acidimicrobiia bacterium]